MRAPPSWGLLHTTEMELVEILLTLAKDVVGETYHTDRVEDSVRIPDSWCHRGPHRPYHVADRVLAMAVFNLRRLWYVEDQEPT